MAYAFNQSLSNDEVNSQDYDPRELTKRERSAARSAIQGFKSRLQEMSEAELIEMAPWLESHVNTYGTGPIVMTWRASLIELWSETMAVDVSESLDMTFKGAVGNVFVGGASRVSHYPVELGFATYDAVNSGFNFFGLFGNNDINVTVGCSSNPAGCNVWVGD